jgi:hypothetical protein
MRERILLLAALIPLLLAVAGMGTASATVFAASSASHVTALTHTVAPLGTTNNPCYESPSAAHCDNTDPFNTDCSIGSYVASSSPVYWYDSENGQLTGGWSGYIQNWYSPHCGTNWARYVDTSGVGGNVNIITCLNDEFVHCTDWYASAVFPTWSNQLYAKTTVATAFADFSAFNGGGAATGQSSA